MPVGSSVDGIDLTRCERGDVLADGSSSRACHRHPRAPARSGPAHGFDVSRWQRACPELGDALMGCPSAPGTVEHIGGVARVGGDDLSSPGEAISPTPRLPEPVPLELPSQRPASMASITRWAPANLTGFDVEARFLK